MNLVPFGRVTSAIPRPILSSRSQGQSAANMYVRIALSFSPLYVQPRASPENSLYDPAARRCSGRRRSVQASRKVHSNAAKTITRIFALRAQGRDSLASKSAVQRSVGSESGRALLTIRRWEGLPAIRSGPQTLLDILGSRYARRQNSFRYGDLTLPCRGPSAIAHRRERSRAGTTRQPLPWFGRFPST